MNREAKAKELLERLLYVINEHAMLADIPQTYGTDELFHRLEIHTIHSIGEHPGINVTELSKLLNVTKSAVSQVLKKLEKRGYILRYQSPDNQKEMLFGLSEKGNTAYDGHLSFHHKVEHPLFQSILQMSDSELRVLEKLISLLSHRVQEIKKIS